MKTKQKYRCRWAEGVQEMEVYHDRSWGKPKKKDQDIFQAIVLDSFQAGLSWKTILLRRDGFKKAFCDFDYERVAGFGAHEIARLMKDKNIIRHRGKIEATIGNAKSFLAIQKEFGGKNGFAKYIWHFTDGKVIMNHPKHPKDMSAHTPLSEKISKDLRSRGFKFVGPTMVYAFMQGIGMVNDHEEKCEWKYVK